MAEEIGKAQLAAEFDISSAKRSMDDLSNAATGMAQKVGKAGADAGAGLAGAGDGAQKGAEKVDKATKSIAASIERAIAVTKAGERGTADFYDALADVRGINKEALKPYIDQLRAVEQAQRTATLSLGNLGNSAKQTRAALQQLPAQFTDIFTSLQGGQAPLTVLLQQGGQLKDVFGGIGPAARAMGGYIAGLINPFTLAAAAAGVLAYGYAKGSTEAQEFNRTLIQTGNASGVTAGQLSAMADQLDKFGGGTTAKAAEVLNTMAASGIRGAESLQRFANAAIEMERAGGPAAEKTAQAFADLAKEPLKASLKLNEAQNYLTKSTYEQIKALEDQGRAVEAAQVAQEAYATALETRTPQMVAQLGYVEQAWEKIKKIGAEARDALLSAGRPDDIQQQLDAQMSAIVRATREIEQAKARGAGTDNSRIIAAREKEIADARTQVRLLQDKILLQQRSAESSAQSAQFVKALAEADKELLQLQDRKTQGAKEEVRVRNLLVAAGKDEKTIAEAIAAVRKKYSDKGTSGAQELEAQVDLLARLSGLTTTYNNDIARLNKLREAGTITEERYGEEVRKLVALQPYMVKATKELTDAQRAYNKELEDAAKVRDRYLEDINKSIEAAAKETVSLEDQLVALSLGKAALNDRIALRLEDQAAAADSAARWTAVTEAESDSYRRLAIQLRAAAEARRKLSDGLDEKEILEANRRTAESAQREWERASDQVGQALADALMQGGDSAAEYIKKLFRTMVLKPIIQGAVQPVANSVLGLLGYGQPQGATGATGGVGQLGQYAQTASTLNTLAGYGQSAYGWAAGSGYFGGSAAYSAAADAALASSGNYYAGSAAAGAATSGSGAAASSSAGMSWGFYAAMAAAIYAQGSKDYANGFDRDAARRTGGPAGQVTYDTSELLSSLGVNDRIADIFGATAVAAIMGRANPRITATGLTGTFGGGDFSGSAYDHIYERGGLLRRSKSEDIAKAVPDDVGRFLDEASKSILEQAQQFGAALGLPAEQLASVTKSISLEFNNGNTQEEIKAALMGALEGYGNALVDGWATAIAPLKTYGETTSQTIDRVGAAISRTNEVLNLLGKTALQASIDGGQAAVDLEKLFGGTDGFRQAASQYLQDFYSETERAALATSQLGQELARFGINTVPATREAYRALVDAQDLTTTAGREAYAALLQLAPAFASVVAATDTLGNSSELTAQQIADAAAKMAEAGQKAKDGLLADQRSLEINLLRASGRTTEANQLQRTVDLSSLSAGVSDSDKALIAASYDYNEALKQQIAALEAATTAQEEAAQRAQAVASERSGLEQQILQAQGDTAALRRLELAALDPSNRALQERIYSLQDAAEAEQELATQTAAAAQAAAAIANERLGLEQSLLQLQGDTAALRQRELEALDPSNRAIQERINALEDEQQAAADAAKAAQEAERIIQEAAQAAAAIASERATLEQRLLQAQGDTAGLRELERNALNEGNRAILDRIFALEDATKAEQDAAAAAEAAAAEAAQRAQAIASERVSLEQRILELQGNTAELRARELASLDPSNRALKEQIYALEDMAKAQADATSAQQESARAAEQLKSAWQSVTDGIFGEVDRIRALMGSGSAESLAQSQSAFAIATAQARAGSQDAAKTLPALAQAMLSLAEAQAGSYLDVQRLRGQTAASLERTGLDIAGRMGLVVPSAFGGSSPAGWDSQQGSTLIADQVQQLRDENRAQAMALADLQVRLLKLMERWETDGMPTTRTTV